MIRLYLQSQRILGVSFATTDSDLCMHHLVVWSNFNFLQFLWITFPTQSYLVLYSFCASLLHSLTMRLIVSSLSPQNYIFYSVCVLSIMAFIKLVLRCHFVVLLEEIQFLKVSARSHVQVFSCEISPTCRLKYPYRCFSYHFCFRDFPVFLFVLILLILFTNPSARAGYYTGSIFKRSLTGLNS